MRKIFAFLVLCLLMVTASAQATDYYTHTATPTQPMQKNSFTAPITTVTASTTALTSLDAYLNGKKEVWVEPSSKVWVNGTTATPSSGIAVYSGVNPFIFRSEVPFRNPGINVIASSTGTTLKVMPVR